MTPKGSSEELRKPFEISRRTAYFAGIDIFDPERRLTALFVFTVLLIVFIYIVCFYTMWMLRSDWNRILEVLIVLLLTFQGSNKMWMAFVLKARYSQLFHEAEQIYAHFDADERNRPLLKATVGRMIFILKSLVLVYSISGSLIVVFVSSISVIMKQKILILTMFVPYIDYTTNDGYVITSFVHVILIAFCVNGHLASDTMFLNTILPVVGYANSLNNEIHNFNLLLEMPKRDENYISERLVHISKLHQMIVEYEDSVIRHFKNGNLIQMVLQAGIILITIFLGYVYKYGQAYCVLMGIFFELAQSCVIGTVITAKVGISIGSMTRSCLLHGYSLQNKQMIIDIYSINWHLLKRPGQQIVAFMLHRAQNAKDLSVGGFAPLNLVTFVQVMKTVYTFFAMLLTFLE